ncbi:hypothetical protein MIND_01315100 [Mycena indigotica]|uniref:WW domain-containing protein n=1 Tax=Mycena indigotica TaxID=2126181 RepID=A0A8H6VR69_9AGAR|nr:uncharacterized protein MIND_01315100 [Mycena indigotica]KAF7290744.1 hypothetical protein MIND_01315100 [Mycena indigotica]
MLLSAVPIALRELFTALKNLIWFIVRNLHIRVYKPLVAVFRPTRRSSRGSSDSSLLPFFPSTEPQWTRAMTEVMVDDELKSEVAQAREDDEQNPQAGVPDVETLSSATPSHRPSLSSIPGFFPTTPQLFRRYYRGQKVTKVPTQYTLPPGPHKSKRKTPHGWIAKAHPEGALYYIQDEKRIFTDAHLHIDAIFAIATRFLRLVDRLAPPNADIVLDFRPAKLEEPYNPEGYTCGYYFVDHEERTVFWDCAFDSKHFYRSKEVYNVTSASHIQFELTAQYWQHCELFPSSIALTSGHIRDLQDVLNHQIGDLLTSPTSTVPFSVDHLLKVLTVVNNMSDFVGNRSDGSMCILARFMWLFELEKFYNFCGEPNARLDSTHSVYKGSQKPSWLIKTASILLFNAPMRHLQAFEQIFKDELLHRAPWDQRVDTLITQYQELILFATVLLNANIAFLAIPIVDNGDHSRKRSVAQIAIYISVIASLGSVIVGLILARLLRDRRDSSFYSAATNLHHHYKSRFGLEPLSILYSLPFALLLWGAFTFLIAFLTMCFASSDAPTQAIVAAVASFMVLGILWCFDQGRQRRFAVEILAQRSRVSGWIRRLTGTPSQNDEMWSYHL